MHVLRAVSLVWLGNREEELGWLHLSLSPLLPLEETGVSSLDLRLMFNWTALTLNYNENHNACWILALICGGRLEGDRVRQMKETFVMCMSDFPRLYPCSLILQDWKQFLNIIEYEKLPCKFNIVFTF